MFYSRLFAAIGFLGFVLALAGTLRLAVAERAWPLAIGAARHFEDLAQRQPALARSALRDALRLNPRDSAAWMALGLAAERDGDMEQAADCFLAAEKVDRQYLPAWTSANFFFRRANDLQFWRAATRAAAMSYDDPAPLIELADHREPNAIAALERLGDSAHLERGYLRFLIGQSRWQEGEQVAARLSLHDASINSDAGDRELLLNFTDRLIGANQGGAAVIVWNRLQQFPAPDRAGRGTLVDQNFKRQPSGHGFDWRVREPPHGSVHWEPSKLEFWLSGSIPDACTLLEQWIVLDPGRYHLRFEYRTEGLAEETGIRWVVLHDGREETSSAALAQAPKRTSNGKVAEWNFRVAKAGLYELAWIYSRVPGTTHQEGRAELTFAGLEML
jgi:tetratricopeptide (TPR) repeat protein